MSSTIAVLSPRPQAPIKLTFYRSPSPAEYDGARNPSPVPSLVNSVTTADSESEAGGGMATPFHVPVPAVGFPVHVEAKRHDGIVYSAGGDESHQGQGPHDADSPKSDFSDNGKAVSRGNNCGHGCSGGGKLGGRGDDGPQDPGPRSPDGSATVVDPAGESKGWPCPYRKHNPLVFNIRDHLACSHLPFSTFGTLKEHLKRKHAPRAGHERRCASSAAGTSACTCNVGGRMGFEAMEKINDMACPTPQKQPTWEAMYKELFGKLEPVPKAEWEAPIELEEYFVEIRQRLGVLRERVKLETRNLIPDHEAIQVKIWSSLTDIFIFFLEQTMSSCQQRVRGNANMSYFGSDCLWSKTATATDTPPQDLLGVGDWSKMFNDSSSDAGRIVHRDICPPSSLLWTVRSGEREFFCRVDCTSQQLLAILGIDFLLAGSGELEVREEQQASMEIDEDEKATPECSPMDTCGLSPSPASPVPSGYQSAADEDAESAASDDEDAIADEMISRVCDIVLRYCGGPSTSRADLDGIAQAVGTAVTDFVHELLNELSTAPRISQCTGRGDEVPTPAFDHGSSGGSYGGSSGATGHGGAGLGGQGTPNSGRGGRGVGGNDPAKPGKGGVAHGKDPSTESGYSCPFRKHNPERFSVSNKRYKQCATTPWSTFDKLKRHLREKHNPTPFECSRCKEGFPGEKALEQHNRSQTPCKVRDTAPTEGVDPDDGMSAHVARRLKSRREEDRILSWEPLYRALFPEEQHIPSRYFEPPEETTCSKIRKIFYDTLPALDQEISEVAPNSKSALMNIFGRYLNQVFAELEASHQPRAGSKRSFIPEDEDASAKRSRMSQDHHPSVPSPSPRFSPLPQQHQIVQRQAADQDWIDVSRTSDLQPRPLHNLGAMFMPQRHAGIMNALPESGSAYLSASGSQLEGIGSSQELAGTYRVDNMESWSNAAMSETLELLAPGVNPYPFSNNYYQPRNHLPMTSDSGVVDEDTGSYAHLGGPSHHA